MLNEPAEAAESGRVEQLRRLAGPGEGIEIVAGVTAGQLPRWPRGGEAECLEGGALVQDAVVAACCLGARLEQHMGREVAGPVRYGGHLMAVPEPGQRAGRV